MKKNMIAIITISICICYIIIMAIVFPAGKEPKPDIAAIQRLFSPSLYTMNFYYFRPEPQERMQYIVDTFSMPFLCATSYFCLSRLFTHLRLHKFRKIYWLLALEVVVIAIIYFFILAYAVRLGFNYLTANLLSQHPILALLSSAVLLAAALFFGPRQDKLSKTGRRLLEGLAFAVILVLILLLSVSTVFNEADFYVPGQHFIAYFDSVVQVFLGKTLLVDISPQYGLYALLLKPIFKLIGLNVVKFTVFMGILKALAYLCIFILLLKATRNKLIAYLGFATILFFTGILVGVAIWMDAFFQYNPQRFVFPTAFVLLLWYYITSQNPLTRKRLYLIITLLCAISVLWNSDTGLVILITWLVYVFYEELLSFRDQKPLKLIVAGLRHLGIILGSTLAAAALFMLYTYGISGQWPSLDKLTIATRLFYFYGFFMQPIRPIHPWNIFIVGYIFGLYLPISFLFDRNRFTVGHAANDPREHAFYKLIFSLSVLGIGLFNYFMGRSHDYNLLSVSWTALVVLTLLMDRLFTGMRRIVDKKSLPWKTKARLLLRHNDKLFAFLLLFYFFSASSASVFTNISSYLVIPRTRFLAISHGMPPFVSEQIQFIQSTSRQNDPVFILSDYAPELYLYTRHVRPLAVPSFTELFLLEDLQKIQAYLSSPPAGTKIYWSPSFTLINLHSFPNLAEVSSSQDDGLFLFEDTGR